MKSFRIDLKVGFSCNNYCRFCVQGDKRSRFAPPSTDKLKHEIKKGKEIADGIVFTGGEPTLRKDLFHLIEYARELGYKTIQIQTNGRMFASKKYCLDAISAGATEFSPALHGHKSELHDYLTRAPGSFKQTCRGIINLKSLGQRVITNSVITKSNFRHLSQIALLLIAMEVDQFQFAFVHPVGRAGENFPSIVPRMEMISPYVKEALGIGKLYGKPVFTEAIPPCIIKGFEDCISERIIPETKVIDAEGIIENYSEYRLKEGKKKGPDCPRCKFFTTCEGPWKEYPEKFGFDEMKPIEE